MQFSITITAIVIIASIAVVIVHISPCLPASSYPPCTIFVTIITMHHHLRGIHRHHLHHHHRHHPRHHAPFLKHFLVLSM